MKRLCLLAFGVTACLDSEPTPNATLSDLSSLRVRVSIYPETDADTDDRSPTYVYVALGYDGDAFRDTHRGECATLDTTRVTINGTELSVVESGSKGEDFDECYGPGFELPAHQLGATSDIELVIDDSTRAITAHYGPGKLDARIATHASWQFITGETAFVTWSHASELNAFDAPLFVSFQHDDASFPDTIPAGFLDDTIRFTIPDNARGAGTLYFFSTDLRGDATSCEGADACEFLNTRSYTHRAVIE